MSTNISTQQLIEIAEIRDDVLILKNGSLRSVIEVSAINFQLRSEEEQVAILQNFQRFLNSIDFSFQISLSSRQLKIDDYLSIVRSSTKNLDELLKIQAEEYARFVQELSTLANIMTKRFYIVVPFFVFEKPTKTGILNSLKGALNPSSASAKLNEEQFNNYREQLMQRVNLILDGLVSLSLKPNILQRDKLSRLFYSLYNPGVNIEKPNE
jgi:type IV secretory pathway VirB4 component